MATLNGFVKLHRKMIEWGWYSDCVVKDVFIHLLMVATFKPAQYLGYELKPGQAVIGLKKLSTELGFSIQQVRTALKKLESTGEISLFSTNRFTIATVENWEFYQGDDEDSNKPTTNEQQTDNKQITNEQQHLKNVKNVKNVKNISLTLSNDNVRSTDMLRATEAWNELKCYGIAPISKLTNGTKRHESLKARIEQYGVEEVLRAIENIKTSSFLKGETGKGWTITFDWFVKPNNFVKVLDGNYNDKEKSTAHTQSWDDIWGG